MIVYIKSSKQKSALPVGENQIDYMSISKFTLRVGAKNVRLAFLGGFVGFLVGAIPGMAITMNDYGSNVTEKAVGPIITVAGGVCDAWWGSRLGARKKVTIEVTP